MSDLTFSQRMGLEPIKQIQINEVDADLRNRIWNFIYKLYYEILKGKHSSQFREYIWSDILKHPINKFPNYNHDFDKEIHLKITLCKWYEFYNIIEKMVNILPYYSYNPIRESVTEVFNELFKKENSAYRFIDNIITPISDEIEIQGIQDALNESKGRFSGVHTHLSTALSHLSDRENPDYRNSVKESVLALESLCKIICNDRKTTLGTALNTIENKTNIKLHSSLKEGYKKIYGYSSDEGGIRHSLLEEDKIDFEDAKYMLVSCSAFVNYLIVKADKAGIFTE